MTDEQVILVDDTDRELGAGLKLPVHRRGDLHRAISVFVFDEQHRLLLQQRALTKYHSPGLWSNTCCGHPRPGESVLETAHRRLREEMGIDCPLVPAFTFLYRVELDNGLIEHEFDHVFTGRHVGSPNPNPAEVAAWRWERFAEVAEDQDRHPERYTAWFRIMLHKYRFRIVPSAKPTL